MKMLLVLKLMVVCKSHACEANECDFNFFMVLIRSAVVSWIITSNVAIRRTIGLLVFRYYM